MSGAPGEVIEFQVRAFDQSGNRRRAVWSLRDNSVTVVNPVYVHAQITNVRILLATKSNLLSIM